MIELHDVTKVVKSGAGELTILHDVSPRIALPGIAATATVVLAVGLIASIDVIVRKPLGSLRGE